MGRGVLKLIFGALFIAGGASGKLSLIGTDSPGLLVGVGVAYVAWGAYQVYQEKKAR